MLVFETAGPVSQKRVEVRRRVWLSTCDLGSSYSTISFSFVSFVTEGMMATVDLEVFTVSSWAMNELSYLIAKHMRLAWRHSCLGPQKYSDNGCWCCKETWCGTSSGLQSTVGPWNMQLETPGLKKFLVAICQSFTKRLWYHACHVPGSCFEISRSSAYGRYVLPLLPADRCSINFATHCSQSTKLHRTAEVQEQRTKIEADFQQVLQYLKVKTRIAEQARSSSLQS